MPMLLALGAMSLNWMLLVAVLIVGQKLLPPRAAIDMALALAIVALGLVVVVAPAATPGLTPSM
jgi:predicted metal-binding membrane protein